MTILAHRKQKAQISRTTGISNSTNPNIQLPNCLQDQVGQNKPIICRHNLSKQLIDEIGIIHHDKNRLMFFYSKNMTSDLRFGPKFKFQN